MDSARDQVSGGAPRDVGDTEGGEDTRPGLEQGSHEAGSFGETGAPGPDSPKDEVGFLAEVSEFLRAVTRPVVTLMLVSAATAVFIRIIWHSPLPNEALTGIVAAFTSVMGMVMAFWFASQTRPNGGSK